MPKTDYLRHQAERCFRLARAVNDHAVVAMLETLGRQLEEQAREVERESDVAMAPRHRSGYGDPPPDW